MIPYTPSQKADSIVNDQDEEAEINRTLYCGDVPVQTTEEELYELFLQAGPLEKVIRPPQKANMAFVQFKHSISLPYAIQLFSNTIVHGRRLRLQFRDGSIHKQRAMGGGRPYQPAASNYDSRGSSRRDDARQSNSRANPTRSEPRFQSSAPVPKPHIQGYRSTEGGEYVPQFVGQQSHNSTPQFRQYVSLTEPQQSFIGLASYGRNVSIESGRDCVAIIPSNVNPRYPQTPADSDRHGSQRYPSNNPWTIPRDRNRRQSDQERDHGQDNHRTSYRR